MRTGAATFVLGVVLMSTASAAQAAPDDDPPSGELVVHTTVTTGKPRRGAEVKAQTWIASTGAASENATLSFSAEPRTGVRISAVCTRTAQGYCKLGDVDSGGTTVPFTIEVPAGSAPLTLTIGAFTRADNARPVGEYTKVTFAPAARKTESQTPSPSASPQPPPTSPSATPAPPPSAANPPAAAPAQTEAPVQTEVTAAPGPSDTLGLPSVPSADPTDGSSPAGYVFTAMASEPPPDTRTTLVGTEVPPALALGQSIWLGVLLAACALAAALAFRRGARIRRRPEDPESIGKHRSGSA
jgi:hypothetical protein